MIAFVADDLLKILTHFHREVVMPDVKTAIRDSVQDLRGDMLSHFDGVYQRFDRLESEYHALAAATARLEDQYQHLAAAVARIETALASDIANRGMLEQQLRELRQKVAELQRRIEELESSVS